MRLHPLGVLVDAEVHAQIGDSTGEQQRQGSDQERWFSECCERRHLVVDDKFAADFVHHVGQLQNEDRAPGCIQVCVPELDAGLGLSANGEDVEPILLSFVPMKH